MSPSSLFPRWFLNVYPSAGEAGGGVTAPNRRPHAYVARGSARDPKRAAEVAGRRARTSLRRYCAHNGLNRLGTLTYEGAGCHDPRQVRQDIGQFFRSLRAATGGDRYPYVWVPEWHKTDHGLHVHFAVGQFIRQSVIRDAWGHGFVSIKLLGDLPVGSGRIEEARKAAGYLAKYAAKGFDETRPGILGLHRYDVAQGFQPTKIQMFGHTSGSVCDQAEEFFGGPPARRWVSWEVEDWDRPPAMSLQWAG